jgi:hypothetical protein
MRLPIWLLGAGALAALTLAGAGSATAQISGTFVATTTLNCIAVVPPATFNSAFQATGAPIYTDYANSAGTITFNSNGTGSANIVLTVSTTTPVPPGTFLSTNTSGASANLTFQFNYTVSSGNIVTMTLASGTFLENILSGPLAGQTATQDVLSLVGYRSADGNEILALSDGMQVATQTFSGGNVIQQVCTYGIRGFKFP